MSGWAPPQDLVTQPIEDAVANAELARTFPVIETFGPTVQGEGIMAGVSTYFVRFGGCDYRCSWCDSMYAVEPEKVREHAVKMTALDIVGTLATLGSGPEWVTLSGGNPALFELGGLVAHLQGYGLKVAVETQGSKWRDWLAAVDCLTVSPKPPSSGMADKTDKQLPKFMSNFKPTARDALKIVVFDDIDYEWAGKVFAANSDWPAFISAGTDPITAWGKEWVSSVNHRQVLVKMAERYAWLCDKVAADVAMRQVRVLPQLHVIAYGHQRGV